jgi:hypothetical protein
MNLHFCVPLSLAVMLLAAVPSRAQEQREGDGELFVLTGGTAGGIGAHPIITGGAGASFTRYLMGLLEASVIPMNDQTLLPTAAVRVHGSDLFDFNFALQGVVPIRKWEPYGTFGLAVLMNPFTGEFPQPSGVVASVGQRYSKFGLEAGAGVRYYVNEKWGVRAEYRYTSSVPNFNRVLGGVFYRVQGTSVFGFLPALARRFR